MKRSVNRQPIDTLYIIGAGASKALTDVQTRKENPHARNTTPIDKDFLARLYHFSFKQGWQKKSLEELRSGWLGTDDFTRRGLEEAIIKRVADYDMLSALYPEKSRKKRSNEDYLNHLSHLVADHLIKSRSNSSGDTKKFVSNIFPTGKKPESYKNRVVTFNYDLILDRPLLERGISKRKVYFDRLGSQKEDGIRRKSDEKFLHPLLLKLHGSVNWRCERQYFNQIVSGTVDDSERIPIWSVDGPCPTPDDDESLLIIPPVPNKPITRASIFRMLWTTALEYLHEAKKIVIVGYSCPKTDVLAQSVFTQFRNMNATDIYIADPASDALPRYHELFSGRVKKSVRWHYYSGFHQYIENELF